MNGRTVTTTGEFPAKPITIIVPFSAGGSLDLVARALEKVAPKYLGQPMVVVNKPGGTGTIGWNEVAGANPDGYTIGVTGAELLLLPLYGPTKYNYPTALDPLVQVATTSVVMAVQADQPWQTVDDLIDYARNHPGQIKFGNSGVGSNYHILGEMFSQASGTSVEQVPFRGSSEALTALLGGHVQVIFINSASIKDHLRNGTVRVLAVATEQRLTDPLFAQIPTFQEQGLDIVNHYWMGVAAPKELPSEVKTKLAEGLKAIISDPEFQQNMEDIGLHVDYLGPEATAATWLTDSQKLGKVVQETGILDRIKAQRN